MTLEIVDKCPTCGSSRTRKGGKEMALIAWGLHGHGLVTEITKGGMLEKHMESMSMSDWADEVFTVDGVVKEGMSIWEGLIFKNENEELSFKGKFRDLTDEEWVRLKDGQLW